MNGGKIISVKSGEIMCVTINLLICRLFTTSPVCFAKDAAMAAPFASIISAIITLLTMGLLLFFYKRSKSKNLIDMAETLFGVFGRYVVGTILIIYLFASNIYTLNEFSELIKTIAYPATPLWFIKLFFVIGALLGAICGFSAIVRTHSVFVPGLIILTLLVSFSAMKYGNTLNLLPVLGKGVPQIMSGGFSGLFLYSDIILLFAIKPFGNDEAIFSKALSKATIFAVIINVIYVFAYSFVIPYPSSIEINLPVYALLKEVWYGRFFQRIDAIYMLFLAISGMLRLALSVAIITHIFKDVFKIMATNVIAVPVSLAIFLLSLNIKNGDVFEGYSLYLVTIVAVAVTVLIMLVSGGGQRFVKK